MQILNFASKYLSSEIKAEIKCFQQKMALENLVTLSPYAQNMVKNLFPILLDYRTVPLLASTVVKFKASPQR